MQKRLLLFLPLFLFLETISAQNFEAVYGETESDVGRAAIFTSDGGTLIIGNTESFGIGIGNSDLYVIRLILLVLFSGKKVILV